VCTTTNFRNTCFLLTTSTRISVKWVTAFKFKGLISIRKKYRVNFDG